MRDFLTEEQVKVLKLTHKTLKDKKLADRIKAVLMFRYGFTTSDVVLPILPVGRQVRKNYKPY